MVLECANLLSGGIKDRHYYVFNFVVNTFGLTNNDMCLIFILVNTIILFISESEEASMLKFAYSMKLIF